jgi:hypothetical protein
MVKIIVCKDLEDGRGERVGGCCDGHTGCGD